MTNWVDDGDWDSHTNVTIAETEVSRRFMYKRDMLSEFES
jgi:hypothetical protein